MSTRRPENASSLVMVIVIGAVIALVIMVIAAGTLSSIHGSGDARRRAEARTAAESASELYRQALEAGVASEATGWAIPPAAFTDLLRGRGHMVPLSSLDLPAEMARTYPGVPPVAVRMSRGEDETSWWQLVRVSGPGYGSNNGAVVAWFRAWVGDDDGTPSKSILLRSELTAGGFHHFQLLSDGPVSFDDGATISGPVHSNGAGGTATSIGIEPGATVTCAGPHARVSAARGAISGIPGGCARQAGSDRTWKIGNLSATFDGIRRAAAEGGQGVVVIGDMGAGAVVQVRLLPANRVDIGGSVRDVGRGLAIIASNDVAVSGSTGGRVTIASDPRDAAYHGRGGTIHVTGDLVAEGDGAAIGLFTEGDVVIDARACPSRVEAAVVATGGALTIDRALITQVAQADSPTCSSLAFRGAVAAHQSPVLHWRWENGAWAGYERRTWSWDPRLVKRPPPWAPVLDGWQVASVRDAALGCGVWTGSAWRTACG